MFVKQCKGCHAIKGLACWLHEVGLDVCDFYECCVTVKERVVLLKELAKNK